MTASQTQSKSGSGSPGAIVVGGGLIGLACATAIARRGIRVVLIHAGMPGESSYAGAGMLAPSLERVSGDAFTFSVAARERFPTFLAELRDSTGVDVPLNREGILELAATAGDGETQKGLASAGQSQPVRWLDSGEVGALEPGVHAPWGALLFERDGAVDNRKLLDALVQQARLDPLVSRHDSPAASLTGLTVTCADGARFEAPTVVLANGAWAPQLDGLPRPIPVEPVRGQMLSYRLEGLNHVIYGGDGYLVPRPNGLILAGSTMERVGFDPSVTKQAEQTVATAVARFYPALRDAPVTESWAGLRPLTPDQLPLLGRDPDLPGLIYACGHSRNGILHAPLTGDCVAALVSGEESPHSLAAFSISRFSQASPTRPAA
jgi:glycine oxidase